MPLTAEFNHGYPAVLKNAIDWTFVEWNHKPVSCVGWGNVGGARAIEQPCEVAVELEVAPLRNAVHVLPDVLTRARAEPGHQAVETLDPRLDLLARDLLRWARTLRFGRRHIDRGR